MAMPRRPGRGSSAAGALGLRFVRGHPKTKSRLVSLTLECGESGRRSIYGGKSYFLEIFEDFE